jgi:hypothetical protein
MEKRTWCYIQQPDMHEIAACACGNQKTQWSEYKDHLWCDKCEKDFIPEHSGIFSGPIPIMASRMLGLSFDRFNIITEQAEILDESSLPANLHYVPCFDDYFLFKNKHIHVDLKCFVNNKFTTKKAALSYLDGEVKVELYDALIETDAKNFNITINFGYPNTKSYNLVLSINDDLKIFKVDDTEEYAELLKYINNQELKYILTETNN